MDLKEVIESVQILNIDQNESTMNGKELLSKEINDIMQNPSSYVVSDADEELIILIQFKQNIDIYSFKLYALDINNVEMSKPKQIHIYSINNINYDFDDIKSMKANKSIICSNNKLQKGQNVNLKKNIKNPFIFKKIMYLAIFIESNQNDVDKTYLNGIIFKGKFDKILLDKKQNPNKITIRKIDDPNKITSYDQLNKLSIKELKQYLNSKNINPTAPPYNIIEKHDLIKLVIKIQKQNKDLPQNNNDNNHNNDADQKNDNQ